MKAIEKKQAIMLREKGKSLKEITKELGVAKSSVSLWVRNVQLTEKQKARLKAKNTAQDKVERSRLTRLANEKYKRDLIITAAQISVPKITQHDLWLIGLMLYWGEGGKTNRTISFSNSDPDLIKIMMMFFREVCGVPEERFRGHIHIHEHLDFKEAEKYWSQISSIPSSKLFKTSRKQSKASKGKKDSLPNGTFNIYVGDVQLFLRMVGWTRGIALSLIDETSGTFVTDKII